MENKLNICGELVDWAIVLSKRAVAKQSVVFKVAFIFTLATFFMGCTYMGIKEIPLEQLKQKYTNAQSKFIEIEGMSVHYRDEGEGPVLILLHGVLSSLHTWDGWQHELGDHYRIIRLDLPGFGLTGPSVDAEYNPEKAVELFHKFVTAMKVDKFYLAGNSLGGFIGWNYALKYPEKVERMILLDPVSYTQDMPWALGLISTPVIGDVARVMTPKFMVDMNVEEVYGDDTRITKAVYDRYFELIMRPGNRSSMVNVAKALKKYRQDPQLSAHIKDIQVPTLLMWGESDRWVPVQMVVNWQRDLPSVEKRIYPGVGHIPMEEIPIQTARDADQFFQAGSVVQAFHLSE